MIPKKTSINKKAYTRPEITRVELDTSLVLLQVSNPTHHHTHQTKGESDKGADTPFASPFGDRPFN